MSRAPQGQAKLSSQGQILLSLPMIAALVTAALVLMLDDPIARRLCLALGMMCVVLFTALAARFFRRQTISRSEIAGPSIPGGHTLVEQAPEGICSIDAENRLLTVNAAAARLFARSVDALVGQRLPDLIAPEARGIFAQAIKECRRSSQNLEVETTVDVADGPRRYVRFSFSFIQNKDAVLCLLQDVTMARQNEMMRHRLTRMISHDLQAPLTSVCLFLDLLKEGHGGKLSDLGRTELERAYTCVNLIKTLSADFSILEQASNGKLQLTKELIYTDEMLLQSIRRLKFLAEQKAIKLVLVESGTEMRGDPLRLGQVFDNIVNNAIKFSPQGSTIKLRSSQEDDAQGRQIKIEVVDNGPGVPPDMQNAIFDSYVQVAPVRTSAVGGGLGLGLSISKMLVELHGGTIEINSVPGSGTVIRCSFPVSESDND